MSHRRRPVTVRIREFRRAEALKRQEAYDKLSLQEKLDRLPPAPQAARQRAKLQDLLGLPKVAKPVVESNEVPRPVDSEGRFINFGDDEPRPLKAKERRAQAKKS